jgi:hypothetical protein
MSAQSSPLSSPKLAKKLSVEVPSKERQSLLGVRNQSDNSIHGTKPPFGLKSSSQESELKLNPNASDMISEIASEDNFHAAIVKKGSFSATLRSSGDHPLFDFGSEDDMFLVEDSDSDLEKVGKDTIGFQ